MLRGEDGEGIVCGLSVLRSWVRQGGYSVWRWSSYGDELVNLDRPHLRGFSAARWSCPRNLIAMYQVVLLYLGMIRCGWVVFG
jgi:hypothetical protein